MRTIWPVLVALLTAGAACEKSDEGKDDQGAKSSEKQAQPEKPANVTIALGDCSGPSTVFESGPRPRPFSRSRVERRMERRLELAKKAKAPKPVKAPRPKDLNQGKMGTKESSRRAGQYAIKGKGTTGDEARELAAERARQAGILRVLGPESGRYASLTGTADFSGGYDDRNALGGLIGEEVGPGGFGIGGAGDGDGKKGRGTIGVAGKGGSGYGMVKARPRGPVPRVRMGKPEVVGPLDHNIIRRFVRRKLPRIRHCYQQQLESAPKLAGKIEVGFVITRDARTVMKTIRAPKLDEVGKCASKAIATIRFPKPKGGDVEVRYPFSFAPPDGVDSTTQGRKPRRPPAPQPGAGNVFAGQETALADCFRKQTDRRVGALVAELDTGAGGAITEVEIHGWGDDAVDQCVAELARTLKLESEHREHRCPVAFGPLSVGEAPGIDVTSDSVSLRLEPGKADHKLTETRSIVADTEKIAKIDGLTDQLRQAVERRRKDIEATMWITGPFFLRVDDDVPMKVVTAALWSASLAGAEPILATRTDGEWTPLPHGLLPDDLQLPVTPMPWGSGGRWLSRGIGIAALRALGQREDQISLLMTGSGIRVGTSKGKREDIDGRDWAALSKALARLRSDEAFADTTEITIGAEDDVLYQHLARAIAVAHGQGFEAWSLSRPASLPVRLQEQE